MSEFRVLIKGTKERLVFNVSTGMLPPAKAEKHLMQTRARVKPLLDVDSMWFPRPDDSPGTQVEHMGNLTELTIEADVVVGVKESELREFVSFNNHKNGKNEVVAKIKRDEIVAIITEEE